MLESSLEKQETSQPRDITEEFLSMNSIQFMDFLRQVRREPALSIVIDWDDDDHRLTEITLTRLKAFLEDTKVWSAGKNGQQPSGQQKSKKMDLF